jgi:hypothetical protein
LELGYAPASFQIEDYLPGESLMSDPRFYDRPSQRDRFDTLYRPSGRQRKWATAVVVAILLAFTGIAFHAASNRSDTAAVRPDTTTGQGSRAPTPNIPASQPATNR